MPLINGIWVKKGSQYFDLNYNAIISRLAEKNDGKDPEAIICKISNSILYSLRNLDTITEVKVLADNETETSINKFSIIDPETNEIIASYPLQFKFKKTLFFGNDTFSIYDPTPSHRNDDYDEYYISDDDCYSLDDWLEDEFGDDAGTAFWNMY